MISIFTGWSSAAVRRGRQIEPRNTGVNLDHMIRFSDCVLWLGLDIDIAVARSYSTSGLAFENKSK